jgi:hypothetical protein
VRLRITLLWAAAAAANLAIVALAPPPAPTWAAGPSPALAEYAQRLAEAERPALAGALLQLGLVAAGVASAAGAVRRLRESPSRTAAAAVGAALGFGAAFFVALQLVMLLAVGIPDFALGVLEEGVIVSRLERSFLIAWLVAVGGAPLGAALFHGGRPLDLRALSRAQAVVGVASVASVAIAAWARQLVLPPRPDILFPALVVVAASVAAYLRGRANAAAAAPPPAPPLTAS